MIEPPLTGSSLRTYKGLLSEITLNHRFKSGFFGRDSEMVYGARIATDSFLLTGVSFVGQGCPGGAGTHVGSETSGCRRSGGRDGSDVPGVRRVWVVSRGRSVGVLRRYWSRPVHEMSIPLAPGFCPSGTSVSSIVVPALGLGPEG